MLHRPADREGPKGAALPHWGQEEGGVVPGAGQGEHRDGGQGQVAAEEEEQEDINRVHGHRTAESREQRAVMWKMHMQGRLQSWTILLQRKN